MPYLQQLYLDLYHIGQVKKTKVLYHEVHEVTVGDDGFNQKVETKYLDFFKFNASRVGTASEKEETVEFKIQIASVFLKAFADSIFVKYDKKTRNLLEFRGLSNLSDEKDQKQQVLIQYSDSPPTL